MKKIAPLLLITTLFFLATTIYFYQKLESRQALSEICQKLEKKNINSEDLEKCLEKISDEECINTNQVCCDDAFYCGVDVKTVIKYIQNYRDDIWQYSSPYFSVAGNPYSSDILARAVDDGTTYSAEDFDARFMDIDLDELENYLCVLKNSDEADNINGIRFYYIKYDKTAFEADYIDKHSLALVPIQKDFKTGVTTAEMSRIDVNSKNARNFVWLPGRLDCKQNVPISNHNQLCPPFTGCITNTLIYEADK